MSRGRFGLLLGLLVVVVTLASFSVVLSLISANDEPTRSTTTTTADTSSTAPDTTSTTTTAPSGLVTPTFVVVVSSDAEEPTAEELRAELAEDGYDAGVLHSDDFASLDPGFWVAYVGPFGDLDDAKEARDDLKDDGYSDAYTACVGSAEDC